MPTVGRTARILLNGFDREGIDHNSSLEDQVVLTYRAVHHYAVANHFKRSHLESHSGMQGPMVMKRITASLFPKADADHLEKLNGLISQVLRKTRAAVCIVPPPRRKDLPIWFVNDSMPHNIVIVALSHAKKPPLVVVDPYRDKLERRLTPEEAGETKVPGPVIVSKVEHSDPPNRLDQLLEIVKRSSVPMTAGEVAAHYPASIHESVARDSLRVLVGQGRMFSRHETPAEKKLRGGGHAPKGRHAVLFWPTDPVPVRTRLPDGVDPTRSAQDWAIERVYHLDEYVDQVLEVMTARGTHADPAPRSVPQIAKAADLSVSHAKAALTKLVQLDLIYEGNNNRFYPSNQKRTPKPMDISTDTVPVEAPPAAEESPRAQTPADPLPVPEDRPSIADELRRLAIVMEREADNPAELEQLRSENERLTQENETLHRALKNLRAAMSAMNELD